MRAVTGEPLPYRDFYYPLNVFMHILTAEEGGVTYLHYGLFDHPGESIAIAQERSTELLLARLPPPPAKLLDVGTGLGTTLSRLTGLGYAVTGITPDPKQVAMVRARYGDALRVEAARFEDHTAPVQTIVFQESSQYIDSESLFEKAASLAPHVVVLDEFSLVPLTEPGALHSLEGFLAAASRHRFRVTEEVDVSTRAAPTIDYFNTRIPRHRQRLIDDLGLTDQQIDDLVASGLRYRQLYRDGTYGYRLLQFRRTPG